MELIADALLIAGAAGAALYCRALGQRLTRLKDLDSGLGAAIATLSRQVDDMRAQLGAARSMTTDQTREMVQLTARAEMAAGRLELLLASLHEGGRRKPVASGETALEKRRAALREAETEEEDPFLAPRRGDPSGGAGRRAAAREAEPSRSDPARPDPTRIKQAGAPRYAETMARRRAGAIAEDDFASDDIGDDDNPADALAAGSGAAGPIANGAPSDGGSAERFDDDDAPFDLDVFKRRGAS